MIELACQIELIMKNICIAKSQIIINATEK